jgi:hypothetical protein
MELERTRRDEMAKRWCGKVGEAGRSRRDRCKGNRWKYRRWEDVNLRQEEGQNSGRNCDPETDKMMTGRRTVIAGTHNRPVQDDKYTSVDVQYTDVKCPKQ